MAGERLVAGEANEPVSNLGSEINEALFGDTAEQLIQRKKMMTHSWPPMPGIGEPAGELFERWGINESEKKLLQLLDLKGHETVLGIGCGTGTLEWYLHEHEKHKGMIVGVDLNAKLFEETSKKINDHERQGKVVNLSLLEWDGENLPPKWNMIDAVIISRVLHHTDAEAMLKEAHRVLKVGGLLGVISRDELHFSHMFDDAEHIIAPQLRALTVPEITEKESGDQESTEMPKYPALLAPQSWYEFGIVEVFNQIPKMGFRSLRRYIHGSPDYSIPITSNEVKEDYLRTHITMIGSYKFTPRSPLSADKPRIEAEDLQRAVYGSIERELELINESIEVFEKTAV